MRGSVLCCLFVLSVFCCSMVVLGLCVVDCVLWNVCCGARVCCGVFCGLFVLSVFLL